MKKFCWFTHTNISSKDPIDAFYFMDTKQHPDLSYDLSKYLPIFLNNEIWTKKGYREEYTQKFNRDDLEKIKSIKLHFHCKGGSFSNSHEYEQVLSSYIDLTKVEHSKIVSSGISRASKIAVIEVEFNSENKIIDYLSYEEEKDLDTIFEKKLTSENIDAWHKLNAIKAIICEFIQFFNFNLHLNYQTHSYEFSFSDKPNLIGFTTVEEIGNLFGNAVVGRIECAMSCPCPTFCPSFTLILPILPATIKPSRTVLFPSMLPLTEILEAYEFSSIFWALPKRVSFPLWCLLLCSYMNLMSV